MAPQHGIIGHEKQMAQLMHDVESGNIAHAYLFSGPRHLGKMTVAKHFAEKLLQHQFPEAQHEAIAEQADKLIHPDLIVLDKLWIEEVSEDWEEIAEYSNAPQGHRAKKPAAKTDTISIDDIRALQERLHEKSLGIKRCCIIRSVERLQDTAANALLKILEEPPEHLVFLLTTQQKSALLPTLVSRTRVLPFHRVSTKLLLPLLAQAEEEDRQFIQHIAQGAPGVVRRLVADAEALRAQRLAHNQATTFWRSQSAREKLQLLAALEDRGEETDTFLLHLALTLREQPQDVLMAQAPYLSALARDLHTNAHRKAIAQRFALETLAAAI